MNAGGFKFLAAFNYEVSACSFKTLANPFRSLFKELVAAFRKPPMTLKIYPNAAVTLKIVLKKRPVMTCKKWTNDREKASQNRNYDSSFGVGDGWLG